MNTFRDPAKNERIDVSMEDRGGLDTYEKGAVRYMNQGTYPTVLDQLDDLMTKGAEAARRARH